MPIESLIIGPVHALVQNTIYATPSRKVAFFFTGTAAQLETSNDGVTFTQVVLDVLGAFIRSTAADTTIVFKAY